MGLGDRYRLGRGKVAWPLGTLSVWLVAQVWSQPLPSLNFFFSLSARLRLHPCSACHGCWGRKQQGLPLQTHTHTPRAYVSNELIQPYDTGRVTGPRTRHLPLDSPILALLIHAGQAGHQPTTNPTRLRAPPPSALSVEGEGAHRTHRWSCLHIQAGLPEGSSWLGQRDAPRAHSRCFR